MSNHRAQAAQYPGVGSSHADIAMRRADAEIEQDSLAIVFVQRLGIGTEFGNGRAAVHRTVDRGQA